MLFLPNIRVAVPEDAPTIFEFIQGFAKRFGVVRCCDETGKIEQKRVTDYVNTEGAVERICDQLTMIKPPFRCLIAEYKKMPVGFTLYYPAFSDWMHSSYPWFQDLYSKDVVEVGDNRIVRKELIKALVREACVNECPRIETQSLVAHAETRVFYTELGFAITPEWEGYRINVPATVEKYTGTVNVRFAKQSDARDIAMFIQGSARLQGVGHLVNKKSPIEKLQRGLACGAFECLIAEVNGVPEGFAVFYQAYSTWEECAYLMIEDLYSFSSSPRQGIGRALFSRLYEIAELRGHRRIETRILTTSRSAPSATHFVEAMGMRSVPGPEWRTFRMDITLERLKGLELYDLIT